MRLPDPLVQMALSPMLRVQADVTPNAVESQQLLNQYGLIGFCKLLGKF